jgi:hypothetical protein
LRDSLLQAVGRFTRLAARDPGFREFAREGDTTADDASADAGEQGNMARELDAFLDELVEEKGSEIVLAALLEWMCDLYEESRGNVQ